MSMTASQPLQLEAEGNGFLIYTSTSDADGTLGGLERQGRGERFQATVRAAISDAVWCSSDPLCSSGVTSLSESLNLAACHSCLLLPETCCEHGNQSLDRAALIGDGIEKRRRASSTAWGHSRMSARGPRMVPAALPAATRRSAEIQVYDAIAGVGIYIDDIYYGTTFGGLPRETLDTLDQHAAVPAAVEDRDLASGRQARPEPPQIMARLFLLGRRGDRMDGEPARIPVGREPLDDSALSRRVPAFEDEDRRLLMNDMRDLDAFKARLEAGDGLDVITVEGLAGFVVAEVDRHARTLRHAG